MGAIMDMAANAHLHTPCLQETKLKTEGIHALCQAFKAEGWRFMPGGFPLDAQGKPVGGVVLVTDWPAAIVIFPLAGAFPHHSLAIVAHWPRQRRLSVISAYLPADDDPLSQRLCSSLGEWAATSGEDFFILAAWNREPKLLPLGYLLAAGAFSALGPDPFFCDLGTHRLENGVYTGRTIDFGISSSGIGTTAPIQRLGPADHDLVAYDIPLKGTRRGWRWQPRRLLDGETTSNWNKLWADVENEFIALLDVGNTEARRIQLFKAGEAGEHEVFGVRLPPTAKGAVNKQGKRRRAPTKITYGKCKRVVQTPKEIAEHPCKFVAPGQDGGRRPRRRRSRRNPASARHLRGGRRPAPAGAPAESPGLAGHPQ